MAELSEDFLGALFQVRKSELQDEIATAQDSNNYMKADQLEKKLSNLPKVFGRRLMRDVNEPAGRAYERGLGSLQRKIDRGATLGQGVGERGAQLALGSGADAVSENLRTMFADRRTPEYMKRNLNIALTQDEITELQGMGYDPYEFMSEGLSEGRSFGVAGFDGKAPRRGEFDGAEFTASAAFNPLSAEFFSGLGMFVDPRSGEQLRSASDVTKYNLSTEDPRQRFVEEARRELYRDTADRAMRGRDQEKIVSRMQSKLPSQYEAAMQGFQDVLGPQGQTLDSADLYNQKLQDLQGSLGSIARETYGYVDNVVRPVMEAGQLAPSYRQFRQQAVQDTGVKDPIALRQQYDQNVLPNYKYSHIGFDNQGNFGLQAAPAQAATPSAGKGSGKGATNQQAQTAQSMFSGYT